MSKQLLITEAEKISIQFRYGLKINLLEQSENFSKEEMVNKLTDTFNIGPKTQKIVTKFINSNFGKMSSKTIMSILLPVLINMTSCQNTGGDECDKDTEIKLSGEMLNKYGKFDTNKDGVLDDFEKQEYGRYAADSIINSATQSFYDDKRIKSEKESGVEIKNVKFPKANEYSDYDAIKFSFKNNTGKNIEAISFSWYDLKDIFGDPIDPVYKGGYDSDGLKKGGTSYGQWDIMEKNVKSGKVYVSKIAFTDGSVWKNE
jgi:hypothetical protein